MKTKLKSPEVGETFIDQHKVEVTVAESCGSSSEGHWFCITHPRADVHNNLSMSNHTSTGSHKMVWICHEHGPEVP